MAQCSKESKAQAVQPTGSILEQGRHGRRCRPALKAEFSGSKQRIRPLRSSSSSIRCSSG